MKIFNKVIWSNKEPENKNDIWFDGSTWKIYTGETWKSNIFVTDFTVADLHYVYQDISNPKQCNLVKLKQALENKEIVLVPYGTEEVKGYALLHGYSEDLLYFIVMDERGNVFSVETPVNAMEIYKEDITFVSPIQNKSDIVNMAKEIKELSDKVEELKTIINQIHPNNIIL